MRKDIRELRKQKITIRMSDAEFERWDKLFKKSYCRTTSEYIRAVILQKPVTLKYRNEAVDEILSVFLGIKKELNSIGNNFNQAVHKLHMLDRIPEFRNWITIYENSRITIENKFVEITNKMDQSTGNYQKK